jgi:hypothetical protein
MSCSGRPRSQGPHSGDCKTSGTAETARSAGQACHLAKAGPHPGLKGTVHASDVIPVV